VEGQKTGGCSGQGAGCRGTKTPPNRRPARGRTDRPPAL